MYIYLYTQHRQFDGRWCGNNNLTSLSTLPRPPVLPQAVHMLLPAEIQICGPVCARVCVCVHTRLHAPR